MIPKYLFDDLIDANLPFRVTIPKLARKPGVHEVRFGISPPLKGQTRLSSGNEIFTATSEEVLHRLNALLYAGTGKPCTIGQAMPESSHATGRHYVFHIDADIPETKLAKPQPSIVCHVRILYAEQADPDRKTPSTATVEISIDGKHTLHTITIFDGETLAEISRISRYSAPRELLTKLIESEANWTGEPSVEQEYANRYGDAALDKIKPIQFNRYLEDSPSRSLATPFDELQRTPPKKATPLRLVQPSSTST